MFPLHKTEAAWSAFLNYLWSYAWFCRSNYLEMSSFWNGSLQINRLFLLGLDKYGKGDWRSISRNFVVSRTPTQVASHAQKYFIRLNSINKDRRRSSIHDITSVNSRDVSTAQGPITGQANSPTGAAVRSPKLHQPAAGPTGIGMYGTTTIGQPVGGPLVSAVGTPVTLPAPSQVAYGMRAPVPGAIVPGAPVNPAPMAYPPMPQTNGHR